MTIAPSSNFPTLDEIMQLTRSIVRDTFTGVGGQQGRIFTNDAPFTLPFLNSAVRRMNRRLRNEGVTFPIRDGVVVTGLEAVVKPDPGVFTSLGFDGYFNGQTTDGAKRLPGDCLQVLRVRQRLNGSNLEFTPMVQAQEGLPSAFQNQWLGLWEWRNYAVNFNGSTQVQDVMLRYTVGQSPFATLPADFSTTTIHVLDCQDFLANEMAVLYGRRNNADPRAIQGCQADADEALDEMALEYVRRQQTVNYNRISYQGGGSNSTDGGDLGQTGTEW